MKNKSYKIYRLYKVCNEIFNTKKWRNMSQFCNGVTHPYSFPYRPYKRGAGRCHKCGARIGKIKCRMKSLRDCYVDAIFAPSPLLKLVSNSNSKV